MDHQVSKYLQNKISNLIESQRRKGYNNNNVDQFGIGEMGLDDDDDDGFEIGDKQPHKSYGNDDGNNDMVKKSMKYMGSIVSGLIPKNNSNY